MCLKIKPVYLKVVFLIICNLNTALDAVSYSKSFNKCLEYNKLNGSIDNLVPINLLDKRPKRLIIGGGQDAEPEQLPFMAALGYESEKNIQYVCGGTLISERFVLTATHCIFSQMWGYVKYVRLGDLHLRNESDNDGVQMLRVERYYIHPNFSYPLKYHDIALLKLNGLVRFSNTVAPACLDFLRDQLFDSHLYAAGWGETGYGYQQSDLLQVGKLIKYNITECRKTFSKQPTLPKGVDDESQICAGAGKLLVDTCGGDSGGPLGHSYVLNDKLIHFVIGVTSFGQQCFVDKIPGVYSRVSYYTDWIESVVWPEERAISGCQLCVHDISVILFTLIINTIINNFMPNMMT